MNNHAARVDRLAREKITAADTMPTREEVGAVIEKMKADPDHVPPWSGEQVERWITTLEAELDGP